MLLLSCLQTAAAVAAQATRVAAVAARVTDSWLSGLLRTSARSAAHWARSAKNVKKSQIDVIIIDMGYDRMEQ